MKNLKSIAALGMQTSPDETDHRVYVFEGFTLNATSRSLKADNCDLDLRPKSFDVLCCLVERAGVLVPKDEIIRKVWSGIHVTDESLARCVSDIRRSLDDREQRIVKTMPGRGYLLAAREHDLPFVATLRMSPFRGLAAAEITPSSGVVML